MDIIQYKQLANLIRDNETYKVYDLSDLEHLTLSLTELNPQKSTTGHSHDNADEVYVFINGSGSMEIGEKSQLVKSGDVVLVPQGNFHKVNNDKNELLSFWTVFEKYEGRGK